MSWEFFEKYVDKAYAVFDKKFLAARKTPSRLKVKDLQEMMSFTLKKEKPARAGKSAKKR